MIPLIAIAFRVAFVPLDSMLVIARELSIFAAAALLLVLVRRVEGQPWSSIGLRSITAGKAVVTVVIGLLACAAATVIGILLIQTLGLQFGGSTASFKPGPWLMCLIVLRAGVVEEFCFRAYAISRLESLTSRRVLSVGLPLVIFAAFHASQGLGGVLLAFLLGGVLSCLYLWRRNLWVNMAVHFLVDFIPNIVLPILAG
ncbi:MAG: CPBP family intramembrane glutamic endopeptidase [Dokdonella sp.]